MTQRSRILSVSPDRRKLHLLLARDRRGRLLPVGEDAKVEALATWLAERWQVDPGKPIAGTRLDQRTLIELQRMAGFDSQAAWEESRAAAGERQQARSQREQERADLADVPARLQQRMQDEQLSLEAVAAATGIFHARIRSILAGKQPATLATLRTVVQWLDRDQTDFDPEQLETRRNPTQAVGPIFDALPSGVLLGVTVPPNLRQASGAAAVAAMLEMIAFAERSAGPSPLGLIFGTLPATTAADWSRLAGVSIAAGAWLVIRTDDIRHMLRRHVGDTKNSAIERQELADIVLVPPAAWKLTHVSVTRSTQDPALLLLAPNGIAALHVVLKKGRRLDVRTVYRSIKKNPQPWNVDGPRCRARFPRMGLRDWQPIAQSNSCNEARSMRQNPAPAWKDAMPRVAAAPDTKRNPWRRSHADGSLEMITERGKNGRMLPNPELIDLLGLGRLRGLGVIRPDGTRIDLATRAARWLAWRADTRDLVVVAAKRSAAAAVTMRQFRAHETFHGQAPRGGVMAQLPDAGDCTRYLGLLEWVTYNPHPIASRKGADDYRHFFGDVGERGHGAEVGPRPFYPQKCMPELWCSPDGEALEIRRRKSNSYTVRDWIIG